MLLGCVYRTRSPNSDSFFPIVDAFFPFSDIPRCPKLVDRDFNVPEICWFPYVTEDGLNVSHPTPSATAIDLIFPVSLTRFAITAENNRPDNYQSSVHCHSSCTHRFQKNNPRQALPQSEREFFALFDLRTKLGVTFLRIVPS